MFFKLYQKELDEKGAIVINCKVKANSNQNEILGFLDQKTIKISIKKRALNNQANLELIKYLKKILCPAKVEIEILKGKTNSLKTLKIIKL